MMRVCHVCDGSVAGDYFRNITAGLTRKGVDVTLVELGPGERPSWIAEIPNADYFSLNAPGLLRLPLAIRRLSRLLKERHIDILHTHLFNSGIAGVLVKQSVPGLSVALMRHHTSVVRLLGSRFHLAADKWMARRVDHLLTVSEAARRYIREVDGVERDDIVIVYLGFDFQQFRPDPAARRRIREEFGFSEDDVVIGYVGNLAPGKGHVQLIDAYPEIQRSVPNVRLFMIGRGRLQEVDDAIGRHGLGRRVVFAGWRNDAAACLNAMDLFIQPSLSEAFSQVLIEAMGVGLPVIATDVGGANEVIESDRNGILIMPNDVAAISRAAVRLLKDQELRRGLSERGMHTVHERFTAEKMVERHFELYQSWVAK